MNGFRMGGWYKSLNPLSHCRCSMTDRGRGWSGEQILQTMNSIKKNIDFTETGLLQGPGRAIEGISKIAVLLFLLLFSAGPAGAYERGVNMAGAEFGGGIFPGTIG